jgi:hypothetical protein
MSATGSVKRNLLAALMATALSVACNGVETTSTTSTDVVGSTTTPGSGLATTTAVPTTTEQTTTTIPTTTTTLALPTFPPGRTNLEHGGDTWAVVLAASEDIDDPLLAEAEGHARDAGYLTGPTDCDDGAATALGLSESDGHYYTVSVYLNSEADAQAALEAFRARGVDGATALVQTFCLD